MSTMLMTNASEKFASARETCPNMSEEIYALTDYIAAVISNAEVLPTGVVMTLLCVMDDLEKQRCGFAAKVEFPAYLVTHNLQVRAQMPNILQVVDAIAEPDFADAVRAECVQAFRWNVPKRVVVSGKISEQDNVNAAVDWWTDTIQHPKMDNGEDSMAKFMLMFGGSTSRRQLTEAELQTFREKLAAGIERELEEHNRATLRVDYGPDYILGEAGDAIGLGQFDFPCKTTMWITETEVSVSAGYGAPMQTIWSASTTQS